jgi:hypothetical protein
VNASEKTGIVAGGIATITWATIHLWLGILATLLTILCLLPTAVKNWRELRKDYALFLFAIDETHSRWLFFSFCIGRLSADRKANDSKSES